MESGAILSPDFCDCPLIRRNLASGIDTRGGPFPWGPEVPMFTRRSSAAARDEEQFAADVLAFLEPLYATALRLTHNRADAEDLVQDTLVKVFRFEDRFEPGTN